MTTIDILRWIKLNLGPIIADKLAAAKVKNPGLLYTEDWLAGIAMRETGALIAKRIGQAGNLPTGKIFGVIAPLMTGDYSQRPGEKENSYHGFGFWQADIKSFPAFVRSGDWKDPAKGCAMAIDILEGKRDYLQPHFPDLAGDDLHRAITAAYNCGEGNVRDVLNEKHDIDIRTTGHDYSKNVWEFREMYRNL